ncbi:ester cyclase [Fulvivirgaceae bacterium BMA10]|uniref:Ester cyclase n=1 Tax=Splendidivirga corallicola TaxID=3051826 RepID=A0ABT8KUP9_9BACT|nr:ester cyclase [Fulvivirgaceae bacterium BMA10]
MTSKEVVKAWFKNIDDQNYDALKSLMASDHKFHNPMSPAPLGVEEHIGMAQMMTNSLQGKHHVEILVEENGWIAVYGRWKGKHVGEFQGVPATGNDVEFTWTDFFQIVDGKISEEYLEMNPLSLMTQIGAAEAQGS